MAPRWNDQPAWLSRLPEGRQRLPEEWPSSGERELLSDGSELELVVRTVAVDPLEEVQTRQMRARLWRDGKLLQEEVHTMRYEEYGKNELVMILEKAGFSDIKITGDYSEVPATSDHKDLVYIARK
jgi:hypothetical protein